MKKRNRRKYLLNIAVFVVLLLVITNTVTFRITGRYIQSKENTKEMIYKGSNAMGIKDSAKKLNPASFKIDSQQAKMIKNVMIIAHPDDETLWAGDHIVKNKYLIICLTNGNNRVRKKEFEKAMKLTGNYGIILNYPDNPKRVKSNWNKVKDPIRNDISYVLNYKKWDSVITHNPEGEYGHIQHKFTSMMVTNECVKLELTNKLEYFGKFYKVNDLLKHTIPGALTLQEAQAKENLMSEVYLSQGYAHRIFDHMIPYEKFIQYKDWYFGA